jgi:CHAD domain-containing protein
MARPLKPRRDAAHQARRILRRELQCARRELHADQPDDQAVHAARRHIKRARATLRLLRARLPRASYRDSDHALRDAGRPLGAARDAKVLLDTFDKLVRQGAPGRDAGQLRIVLLEQRRRAQRQLSRSGVRRARQRLREVRRQAARWGVGAHGWNALLQELGETYRKGRGAARSAREHGGGQMLHRWRKLTKYLYYELELLEPLRPRSLGPPIAALHRLSDVLGHEHDLAVLRQVLTAAQPAAADGARDAADFMVRVERAQAALQARALRQGVPLYRERPAHFTRRMRALCAR